MHVAYPVGYLAHIHDFLKHQLCARHCLAPRASLQYASINIHFLPFSLRFDQKHTVSHT